MDQTRGAKTLMWCPAAVRAIVNFSVSFNCYISKAHNFVDSLCGNSLGGLYKI